MPGLQLNTGDELLVGALACVLVGVLLYFLFGGGPGGPSLPGGDVDERGGG